MHIHCHFVAEGVVDDVVGCGNAKRPFVVIEPVRALEMEHRREVDFVGDPPLENRCARVETNHP